MAYSVPRMEGDEFEYGAVAGRRMWEVFIRARRGLNHVHAGSLHAPDPETALQNARDVYTRRGEGVSVWVVASEHIHAFDPGDAVEFADANLKPYRDATHYHIPDEVGHM